MNQREVRPLARKQALLILLSLLLFPAIVLGTWDIILNEYFEDPAAAWPWSMWHIGGCH
jgi:hypothetical protein